MDSIQQKAHAKVNIGLRILNRRPDGYHNIHTVFQELDTHDTVTLARHDADWFLTTNVDWVPQDESNLCVQAYRAFKDTDPRIGSVSISLEKMIPAGAGLGGGSSNGAAVIKGLNQLYNLSLSNSELESIGKQVGADVPFFIRGGTQIGNGIGDELTPLQSPIKGYYLLVIPELFIDTAWAYKALKKPLETSAQRPNFARFLLGDSPSLAFFENDFERIVIPAHPEIGEIKKMLLKTGAEFASLSGSGSTVCGIFDDEACAQRAESNFSATYRTILATPTNL